MNSKIQDFIVTILKILTDNEKSEFSVEGRESANYMDLYRIYKDSKNDKALRKNLNEFIYP